MPISAAPRRDSEPKELRRGCNGRRPSYLERCSGVVEVGCRRGRHSDSRVRLVAVLATNADWSSGYVSVESVTIVVGRLTVIHEA